MKHTTKTFALLLLTVAAGNSAQAQVKKAQAGAAYTISSVTAATGTGITYQWYRNGLPLNTNSSNASYTVPADQAYGTNVEFKRGVISTSCAGDVVFSNAVVITFCNAFIGGACWADANVAQPGTLAARPDMYTEFYQWNRPNVAWAATGSVSGWTTSITDPEWNSHPCPEGWRLPMNSEWNGLSTGTWVEGGTKGSAVGGMFFGPNHATCTLPSNMSGCIFLSAAGYRGSNSGMLSQEYGSGQYAYGYYWSSTPYSASTTALALIFSNNPQLGTPPYGVMKADGLSVRCVLQ